ncbi:MAG: CpaF family protein [Ktedonobacteraceae bacterium]
MLVRNTVMPPLRPKMQEKLITPDEGWLNDIGPLSQPKASTQKKQETVVRTVGGTVGRGDSSGYGPLEPLLRDDSISEITCIGPRHTYVERNGLLEKVSCYFADEGQMLRVIEQMVRSAGQSLQPGWPIIDVRLPNGMQLNAVLPPSAVNGPTLTLSKGISQESLTLADMVRSDTLSQPMADVLQACVEGRLNILICGAQNSGRTTLLNALCAVIPEEERIITIEESAELHLRQKQVIGLVTQSPGPQIARNVTLHDLVTNALKMGPERIILGECRGDETMELLQALYTGHNGSLMTAYATNAQNCLIRFEKMCHNGDGDSSFPLHIIRRQIVDSVDVIVQVSRMPDGSRKIVDIAEVQCDGDDRLTVQSIFTYLHIGLDSETGKVTGDFEPCGISPKFLTKLAVMDIHLAQEAFIANSDDDTVKLLRKKA